MGRLNSISEKTATLKWGQEYKQNMPIKPITGFIQDIKVKFDEELKSYFSLAALSRSQNSPIKMVNEAYQLIFHCRTILEKRINTAIAHNFYREPIDWIQKGAMYGSSKKQGTSLRMPLSSCIPTKLCGAACYAHDVLDAAPATVIRGVINGLIAESFETGSENLKSNILIATTPHTKRAIRSALQELKQLEDSGWSRRPYIRFAHVGEIAAFPNFSNAIAKQVKELSKESVDCVVYTRHKKANQLDPTLWVINFTLDETSKEERLLWIPPTARTVFSAFGGRIDSQAEVNFLEHHRWIHFNPIGHGTICPATLPETKDRRCDGVKCDRCFRTPVELP